MGKIGSEKGEDYFICWHGLNVSFLECVRNNFQKEKTINGEYYANLVQHLTAKIKEKASHLMKEKL